MKYFYWLVISFHLLLATACRLPEYYQERKDYDALVRYSVNRLHGKKKSTEHIKTLEANFALANARDMALMDSLQEVGGLGNIEAAYQLSSKILQRHEKVEPLLPLVSRDGYRPLVRLLPVKEMTENSRRLMIEAYTQNIREKINHAKEGDKMAARKAFSEIRYLEKKYSWEDSAKTMLKDSALALGRVFILLEMESAAAFYSNRVFQRLDFWGMHPGTWHVVHHTEQLGIHYDYIAVLKVNRTDVSFENTNTRCTTASKEIQVGQKEVKDTSGKVTYEPIFETVTATIYEIEKSKTAEIQATLEIFDASSGQKLRSEWISESSLFCERYCTYTGDSRAVNNALCSTFSSVSFPSDWEMIDNCTDALRCKIEWRLNDLE